MRCNDKHTSERSCSCRWLSRRSSKDNERKSNRDLGRSGSNRDLGPASRNDSLASEDLAAAAAAVEQQLAGSGALAYAHQYLSMSSVQMNENIFYMCTRASAQCEHHMHAGCVFVGRSVTPSRVMHVLSGSPVV